MYVLHGRLLPRRIQSLFTVPVPVSSLQGLSLAVGTTLGYVCYVNVDSWLPPACMLCVYVCVRVCVCVRACVCVLVCVYNYVYVFVCTYE